MIKKYIATLLLLALTTTLLSCQSATGTGGSAAPEDAGAPGSTSKAPAPEGQAPSQPGPHDPSSVLVSPEDPLPSAVGPSGPSAADDTADPDTNGLPITKLSTIEPAALPELKADGHNILYDQQDIARANIQSFGDTVVNSDPEANTKNQVYSPLSTWTAYSLFSEGIHDKPLTELRAALESTAPLDPAWRERTIRSIIDQIRAQSPALDLHNYFFVSDKKPANADFLKSTAGYRADVYAVDFDQNKGVTDWLNKKISKDTRGLISRFYSEPIDKRTDAILMNIICMDAAWQQPFDPKLTKNEPFHRADGSTVDVPMMRLEDQTGPRWAGGKTADFLELSYESGERMILALPHPGKTPAEALDELHKTSPEFAPARVDLRLPRTKIETSWDLKKCLTAAGLGLLFDPNTQGMDGILEGTEVYISDSQQKAVIDINEKGTKAAAVTTIDLKERALEPPAKKVSFVCDRPFAFSVQDVENGIELFRGLVYDPSASAE